MKSFHGAGCRCTYLAVYFVAVILGAHLDELAIDSLEDVEDVPHQRRLAHLSCTDERTEELRYARNAVNALRLRGKHLGRRGS